MPSTDPAEYTNVRLSAEDYRRLDRKAQEFGVSRLALLGAAIDALDQLPKAQQIALAMSSAADRQAARKRKPARAAIAAVAG